MPATPELDREDQHGAPALLLNRHEVRSAIDVRLLIDALRRAFVELSLGRASVPSRVAAHKPDGSMLLAMPGYVGNTLAAKLLTIFPENPAHGLRSHQAVVILFEDQTGRPAAIMDGSSITAMRTGCATAIATDLLARKDAKVLAILGAGVQGQAHLETVPLVRNFREIRLASRSHEHALKVAKSYDGIAVADSFEDAVRDADVICACTDSPEPIVRLEWLTHGAHVNSVGFGKGPELDKTLISSARLFVESRSAFQPRPVGAHELQGLDPSTATELGELLGGSRSGRTNDDELTVYKATGHAIEDATAARLAYEMAAKKGVGIQVYI